MGKKLNLDLAKDYQVATMAAFGQHKLAESEQSLPGFEYSSVYSNATGTVINYDSAANPNHGDASFTNIKVPDTGIYIAPMKNIFVVSGELVANIY